MLITWLKSVLQGAARARGQVEKGLDDAMRTIVRPDWSQFEAFQKNFLYFQLLFFLFFAGRHIPHAEARGLGRLKPI